MASNITLTAFEKSILIIYRNVPWEARKLMPVEDIEGLAVLALQSAGVSDEAGSHSQATSDRNMLSL